MRLVSMEDISHVGCSAADRGRDAEPRCCGRVTMDDVRISQAARYRQLGQTWPIRRGERATAPLATTEYQ